MPRAGSPMRRLLPLSRGIVLTLPALLTLAAAAQIPAPVSGLVTSAAGRPLAGVIVSSGTGSVPDAATSSPDGRFQLANSTTVLHATLDGYQPLTLLIHPPATDLRIQLQPIALAPPAGIVLVPVCTPLPPNDRNLDRLGAGDLGLQFTVPHKGWELHNLGQGDLHEYLLTPRHSHAQLTLWFGANGIELQPEDHFFLESTSFAQRAIVVAGAAGAPRAIGIDSSGTYSDGGLWRHLATPGSAATYDHAAPRDAALFDAILASLCVSPAA